MAGNSFGQIFRIHTYGESHGPGIGVVIDGCPAGLAIDAEFIASELLRRKPGQSRLTTSRNESETFDIQSGVFEGVSTGTPIAIYIPNSDAKSKDYSHLKESFRPSHADMTYQEKYGIRDYKGGGRSSARETAARVAAGAIAKLFLQHYNIQIHAGVVQVGHIQLDEKDLDWSVVESNPVRCPSLKTAEQMEALILETKKLGDTLGGRIRCEIINTPAGLGEPVFDRLHADLAKAMLSINAVKGFSYGSGFSGAGMKGSEHNDQWIIENGKRRTKTNFSGGIQGGISNGMPIYFDVAFKPVATLMQDQHSITQDDQETVIKGKGRHDPCVVPRAVPIVEAMAALVIADHLLRSRLARL